MQNLRSEDFIQHKLDHGSVYLICVDRRYRYISSVVFKYFAKPLSEVKIPPYIEIPRKINKQGRRTVIPSLHSRKPFEEAGLHSQGCLTVGGNILTINQSLD